MLRAPSLTARLCRQCKVPAGARIIQAVRIPAKTLSTTTLGLINTRHILPRDAQFQRLYSTYPDINDIAAEDVEAVERFMAKFSRDKIPYKTFEVTFQRSSGAGGQNVNKLNTKVYMRFSLEQQAWLPKYVRRRMQELDAKRVNGRGEYLITSEKTRMQRLNLEDCLDRLWEAISAAAELPKGPDEETIKRVEGLQKAEKFRNKENKKRLSMRKSNRRKGGSDDC
ncbi:hypothetical protein LPJ66_011994 [Kickxella alabastrina]|uniref:Uncharacterized protein n=1 Tax=Kickxella alabastrina TaxID=61397 RepID=A0ACC1I219_9FUNG|nr:hypothetical protein LPJ66_011994 [Kickxella alabastrina]